VVLEAGWLEGIENVVEVQLAHQNEVRTIAAARDAAGLRRMVPGVLQ
jgi:hypothetical protein